MPAGAREEVVGDGLGERREHGFGDARADLGGAAGDGARVARVQERPVRIGDVQRLEASRIDRHVREHVLDGQVHRGLRRRDHAVERTAAWRARLGEVEVEVRPLLPEPEPDGERIGVDAVGVDEGLPL
mgnify:CR=1 FL=1